METKQIAERGPMTFCLELQQAVQEGWTIDENVEFNMFWDLYTIGMVKGESFHAHEAIVKKQGRPAKQAN
jgi:hypothetical protein